LSIGDRFDSSECGQKTPRSWEWRTHDGESAIVDEVKGTILLVEDEVLLAMRERMDLEKNGQKAVTDTTGKNWAKSRQASRASS